MAAAEAEAVVGTAIVAYVIGPRFKEAAASVIPATWDCAIAIIVLVDSEEAAAVEDSMDGAADGGADVILVDMAADDEAGVEVNDVTAAAVVAMVDEVGFVVAAAAGRLSDEEEAGVEVNDVTAAAIVALEEEVGFVVAAAAGRLCDEEDSVVDGVKTLGTEAVNAAAGIATDTICGVAGVEAAAVEDIEPMPSAGG